MAPSPNPSPQARTRAKGRRVAHNIAQDPGSADGETQKEHGKHCQAGLRRFDVLERIRGDRAGVVGRDLGKRAGGIYVAAPRLLELSTSFADAMNLFRPGRPSPRPNRGGPGERPG